GIFRVRHHGRVVAAIPGQQLVDECPIYHPDAHEADDARARRGALPPAGRPAPDPEQAMERLLDSPSLASKRWVYEQYDATVQGETVLGPGGDAGVLRVPGTDFGLAVTVDCNARLVALDPHEGGKAAVAEAARNIACTGALPIGITDCLNFGNPEKPEVFFQFREACRGIADACRAFETPVTGGNVSFYNESPTGAVDPTPTIGMVGLLQPVTARVPSHFREPGDIVVVLGATRGELGGSAYWAELLDFVGGRPAAVDLDAERRLQLLLVAAAQAGLLRSAHDCSEGGLAVALAEAAIGGPYAGEALGVSVDLTGYAAGVAVDGLLFGEDGARVVVSCAPSAVSAVLALAAERGVPAFRAGTVGAPGGRVELRAGNRLLGWSAPALRRIYFEAIPRRMAHANLDR
ncbi:MAG TPA: AIR synthase related protein, partial [Gemmatimonadales bacterium]|nr:AIR synthase related protein [Gemmatimonadales bacterium]